MSDTESENDEIFNSNQKLLKRKRTQHKKSAKIYLKKITAELASSTNSSESSEDDDSMQNDGIRNDSDCESDWTSASEDDDDDGGINSNGGVKKSKTTNMSESVNNVLSDSSGSDSTTDKCPICLLSFRNQEIGIPETCDHTFCYPCIEHWSKNVSNCPIDRKFFSVINVKDNIDSEKIIRTVKVDQKLEQDDELLDMDIDLTSCDICGNSDREDCMLLCDECNHGFHLDCLTPPLSEVPTGSWYCNDCFTSESSISESEIVHLQDEIRELNGVILNRLRNIARNAPRIARTRQSERIRASIIARTRGNRNPISDPAQPSTSSGLNSVVATLRRRIRNDNMTTTVRKRRTRRRRRTRIKKTVIEYGIDEDNNKFPVEVISSKRRRRKRKRQTCRTRNRSGRISKRKLKTENRTELNRNDLLQRMAVPKLHLFGSNAQLEYFSDSENSDGNSLPSNNNTSNYGGPTAVTSIIRNRISSRRTLNRQKAGLLNIPSLPTNNSPIDLLSSILETQDRWLNTRNLENIQIASDGSILLDKNNKPNDQNNPIKNKKEDIINNKPDKKIDVENSPIVVNEAPMYPRTGSGNFNSNRGYYNNSRGSGGGGGYNRRDSNQYHSGDSGNNSFNSSFQSSYNNFNSNNSYNQSGNYSGSGQNTPNYSPFNRGRGRGNFNRGTNNQNRFPNSQNRRSNNNLFNTPPPTIMNTSNSSINSNVITPVPMAVNEEVPVSSTSNENHSDTSSPLYNSRENLNISSDNDPEISQSNIEADREEEKMEPDTSANKYDPETCTDDQYESNALNLNKEIDDKNKDEDSEDDCPNFAVYSSVSMDIAKESETSEQGCTKSIDEETNNDENDEEKLEDLVQLDDEEELQETQALNGPDALTQIFIRKDNYDSNNDETDGDIPDLETSDKIDDNKTDENISNEKNQHSNNKKSVLELYDDDSDWEELEKNEEEKQEENTKTDEQNENASGKSEKLTESISEDERSYTPCLDEKNQCKSDFIKAKSDSEEQHSKEIVTQPSTSGIGGLETEMISDEDDAFNDDKLESPRREPEKLSGNKKKSNTFKKISKNTKGRNYRDKDKKRKRSRSRSNDKENRNKMKQRKSKIKRKDLERYNVRTVVERHPKPLKDKYGRDLSTRVARSPSRTPSRDKRSRRRSSSSPFKRRSRSYSRSPRRRSRSNSKNRRSRKRSRRYSRSRSRTLSPSRNRLNGKSRRKSRSKSCSSKSKSRSRSKSQGSASGSRSRSFSISRSRSPIERPVRRQMNYNRKTKKNKRRIPSFNDNPPPKKRFEATESNIRRTIRRSRSWNSPRKQRNLSRSKTPEHLFEQNVVTWTPPHQPPENLTVILKNKDTNRTKKREKKRKVEKKKDKLEKRRKSKTREKQASPIPPSKEVFASGDNILVSVSFNKNQEYNSTQQTTVVTLPPTRNQIVTSKRRNDDNKKSRRDKEKGSGKKHKKSTAKPVAIIDLDRSPFKEVTPSPKAVIILSDSENEAANLEKQKLVNNQDLQLSCIEEISEPHHRVEQASQPQSPVVDDTFELQISSGPKTPPEPLPVKFSMAVKSKTTKLRPINPLHSNLDDDDENEESVAKIQQTKDQKGPNTPPEPAPTSPDAYDPFEPTKSPSASPSPAPIDMADMSTNDEVSDNIVESTQDMIDDSNNKRPTPIQPEKVMNPVDLVMALISTKTSTATAHADISSTSGDNFNIPAAEIPAEPTNSHTSPNEKPTEDQTGHQKSITVLSNVLIQPGNTTTAQIKPPTVGNLLIPTIPSGRSPSKAQFNTASSTTKASQKQMPPTTKTTKINLPLPKVSNNRFSNDEQHHGDESPYSPGSSDYDDLFEPPPELTPPPVLTQTNLRAHNKNLSATKGTKNLEIFDNLFGSASPVGRTNKAKHKKVKKTHVKVYKGIGKMDEDQLKILDDLPSSAVALQVKDKYLRKLNRQERVVEEVKLVLKPHYNKKHVTKEEYKDILRRAVPKICHNRTGEINPIKIHNLIEAYVRKFRHKRKLSTINNGNSVVSSSNKVN